MDICVYLFQYISFRDIVSIVRLKIIIKIDNLLFIYIRIYFYNVIRFNVE